MSHPTTHESCLGGQYSLGGQDLTARLLPEVSPNAITITTSIPATSATSPQPDVLGAFNTLGMGVGVATGTDAGAGVGVAPAVTSMLTVVVLPAAEPSGAYLRNLVTGTWQ